MALYISQRGVCGECCSVRLAILSAQQIFTWCNNNLALAVVYLIDLLTPFLLLLATLSSGLTDKPVFPPAVLECRINKTITTRAVR